MAPYCGPTPESLVAKLRDPKVEAELPLSMGGPGGPTAQFGWIDGDWCLYRLAVDEAAFTAFCQARHAAGEPLYPEHRMRFLRPAQVLLRAPSREGLLAQLDRTEVTLDPNDQVVLRPRA